MLIDVDLIREVQRCECDRTTDAALNLLAAFPDECKATVTKMPGAVFIRNEVKPPMNRLFFDEPLKGEILESVIEECKKAGKSFGIGLHPYMEATEGHGSKEPPILTRLLNLGFTYGGQSFSWIRETADVVVDDDKDFEVVRYDKSNFDEFFKIWCEDQVITGNEEWYKNEIAIFGSSQWHRYILFYKGKPAALSISYHNGQILSCMYHETRSEFRRKGLQLLSLLLRTRDARELGCKYIIGVTAPSNFQSQRNFQRAGFRLGANWIRMNWNPA